MLCLKESAAASSFIACILSALKPAFLYYVYACKLHVTDSDCERNLSPGREEANISFQDCMVSHELRIQYTDQHKPRWSGNKRIEQWETKYRQALHLGFAGKP